MTVEKAIKINRELVKTGNYDVDPKFTKAIKLGIEALKREQWRRARYANDPIQLLSGETKE